MGSWSVYCGISQITITSGHKCVLLPLKEEDKEEDGNQAGYLPYLPATLPIFGTYDDYGGLEDIEEDENTKLIEKHFGCKIDEFCSFFTRGCIDDTEESLKENKEIKDWKFMFIDREVYDFMSTFAIKGYGGKGHLSFGDPQILELLGFSFIKKTSDKKTNPTYDPQRFNQLWEHSGKKFYSDGTWLQMGKHDSIYDFRDLVKIIEIPEDKMWIGQKTMWQLYDYLDPQTRREKLYYIIGGERNELSSTWLAGLDKEEKEEFFSLFMKEDEVSKARVKELSEKDKKTPKTVPLYRKYLNDSPYFNKLLCDLVTIRYNLHPMSGSFQPYLLYLTPQCGEHEHHQSILLKFALINEERMPQEEEE